MKFMNEQGEVVEGTYVSDAKVEALDFLRKGLENEKYEHLGIKYVEISLRDAVVKFIAKNFNIERISQPELVKAEESQQYVSMSETDNITF